MLGLALIATAVTSLAGLALTLSYFYGVYPSWRLSVLHGFLGAWGAALVLAVSPYFSDSGSGAALGRLEFAAGALVISVLLGCYAIYRRVSTKPTNIVAVYAHAAVAVTGLALLSICYFEAQ